MCPMPVVVVTEHREDALEVTGIENQKPVEAFRTNCPHESFGDPVRMWGLDRCPNDSDSRTLEHVVKGSGKFSVVIANQDTNRIGALGEHPRQLTRLLC